MSTTEGPGLLRAWREAAGLSQSECARRVNVAQSAWNTWEHGVREPQIRFAVAIEELTSGAVPVRAWLARPPSSPAAPAATGTEG